jgi:hypothetical protein
MPVVGLDIGGANLKAADNSGWAATVPFALWKSPRRLAEALHELIQPVAVNCLAVTMTGELADCFPTKSAGVAHILQSVVALAGSRPVSVWSTRGLFLTVTEAVQHPPEVAAANWHALATWLGRSLSLTSGLLIDIGTTTTDIIPLRHGRPNTRGLTDRQRLQAGELVYTGVRRTPLCALSAEAPWDDLPAPLAAELFATTLDLGLSLGHIAENPSDLDTANGRPATFPEARQRLARQLCGDTDEVSPAELDQLARALHRRQVVLVQRHVERVLDRQPAKVDHVIFSGSGEFLAREVCQGIDRLSHATCMSLREQLGAELSTAATAYALAQLLTAE